MCSACRAPSKRLDRWWERRLAPSVCYGGDRAACVKLAHRQFRWGLTGWAVQSDLPKPKNFDGASRYVREEDVAREIPCGPDAGPMVKAVKQFADAGFIDVALVQIGPEQASFCEFYERELAKALRTQ